MNPKPLIAIAALLGTFSAVLAWKQNELRDRIRSLERSRDLDAIVYHTRPGEFFPLDNTDVLVDGVNIHIDSVRHPGSQTRISGTLVNTLSTAIVPHQIGFVADTTRQCGTRDPWACSDVKSSGMTDDIVELPFTVLSPGEAMTFAAVVSTPADSSSYRWRVKPLFKIVSVRQHRR